ncbi:MAG: excinuclease ABC subunit UvrA [Candidatus Eisenbacteria bacterium]|uniref:UvrABC system protein A n=1 Tax=Eiseniibacteriota bacterium TaxID=2212470 RepID=A0A937XA97_UNCEI|nr:excinuclease ABC subunit UvrA [Candidatus Eisenbacteria bacterium]
MKTRAPRRPPAAFDPGWIEIRGAREHNLQNIDLRLRRGALIVVTGVSGSGKSSLAFDTLYAEGQRRYVESLSAYARQFLGQLRKPDADHIQGLSPAIAIEQRSGGHNPRSTLATVTEIYDYLRVLYARVGVAHCPDCRIPVGRRTIDEIAEALLAAASGERVQVLAPIVQGRKGEYRKELESLRRAGFQRARIDGEIHDLDRPPALKKTVKHTIEAVVDRLTVERSRRARLIEALETALKAGGGVVLVAGARGAEQAYSEKSACVRCGRSFPEPHPRNFSFNSPYGACSTCQGLGVLPEVDPQLVVADPERSLFDGALATFPGGMEGWMGQVVRQLGRQMDIDFGRPWRSLPEAARRLVLRGSGEREYAIEVRTRRGRYAGEMRFEGVIPNLERRYRETRSAEMREWIARLMAPRRCPDCQGGRLRPESLAVRAGGFAIQEWTALSVRTALARVDELCATERDREITRQVRKEIGDRLRFLHGIGLGYLTLDRGAATLSSGEMQRIRLATQIGSQLVGVVYVLDEPSIGLHARDNRRLLDALMALRDLGNTVVVVEHDIDTVRAADQVIDLGPGAGRLGGRVVAQGTPAEVARVQASLTGAYLAGRRAIDAPLRRRPGNGKALEVRGAREHNLRDLTVRFPLGCWICVTGVSGSGKSTLVNDILYRALARRLHRAAALPGAHAQLRGVEHLDKVIAIDQAPIGRTPRSNPATYTGAFTLIRGLFAQLPEARARGYGPGRFSFNVKGGRCEACQGDGMVRIEMHFLPDVYVTCDICNGRRYNRETLEVAYRGRSIHELLEATVEEAAAFFAAVPQLARKLDTLRDVGLGYLRLGQAAPTLSGGEAQRVKLAAELSRAATGKTLYILDEPTSGLHLEDIRVLLGVLSRLVDAGNTVLVIEHHLDVIRSADWVIDLGPEGGEEGGGIVVEGTPEEVARCANSWTGKALAGRLASS